MSSSSTWALDDLEKQDVAESGPSPTEGGTTLADDNADLSASEDNGFPNTQPCLTNLKAQ